MPVNFCHNDLFCPIANLKLAITAPGPEVHIGAILHVGGVLNLTCLASWHQ